jgi:hypothetical protein
MNDDEGRRGPRWWEQLPAWIMAAAQVADVVLRVFGR